MLRRTMAERFLTTYIPRCSTAKEVSDCIAELTRVMESNSRNIIVNYTNFVLSSRMCLKTPIEDENGVLKDGLMDFIATRAQPNMFHKFDHVMEKMKQAWSDMSTEDQALDDLCGGGSSSSSSSNNSRSALNLSLLQCAKELVECWKTQGKKTKKQKSKQDCRQA